MKTIKNIIEKGTYKSEHTPSRIFRSNVTAGSFKEIFIKAVHNHGRFNVNKGYIIDDYNQDLINQFYLYLIGDDDYYGDIYKGILLLGKIGCGKTLLMKGFLNVFEATTQKVITGLHAKSLHNTIKEKGIEFYYQRPLFIDDIGKEPIEAKDYGNESKPFEDLISHRYNYNGIMFGTSNLTLEDMPYQLHTQDRLKEMFNIIVMNGDSRRL